MERWRCFFELSKTDIWTVILQAITVAATDYPTEFRERRHQIAETLFDRSLLQRHAEDGSIVDCNDGEINTVHVSKRTVETGDIAALNDQLHAGDAEALSDELEEEALVLRDLHGIRKTLVDVDQPENAIVEALQRLLYMQITVDNLKATEIGKSVRILKKHASKKVQALAKELMRQWKATIDEWLHSVENVTSTAINPAPDYGDDEKHGIGLLVPPLDESALLQTGSLDMDLSQLLNFTDGEDLRIMASDGPLNSADTSGKDNLDSWCSSQSGSIVTESSDFDTKGSTNHSWGLTTPDERCSTTRDVYASSVMLESERPVLEANHLVRSSADVGSQGSKSGVDGAGLGRRCKEVSPGKHDLGLMRGTATGNVSIMNWNNGSHDSVVTNASNGDSALTRDKPAIDYNTRHVSNEFNGCRAVESNKHQKDHKLEMSKRKLHQSYEEIENARKRRTVKFIDPSDIPMSNEGEKVKTRPHLQNKHRSSSAHTAKLNATVYTQAVRSK